MEGVACHAAQLALHGIDVGENHGPMIRQVRGMGQRMKRRHAHLDEGLLDELGAHMNNGEQQRPAGQTTRQLRAVAPLVTSLCDIHYRNMRSASHVFEQPSVVAGREQSVPIKSFVRTVTSCAQLALQACSYDVLRRTPEGSTW